MNRAILGAALLAAAYSAIAAGSEGWVYERTKDALGERTFYSAKTTTDQGVLMIVGVGDAEPGLTFAIARGSFYCPVRCTVRIKVDEEESIPVEAKRVSNVKQEALAVYPPIGGVLSALKKGERVRIAAPLRDKGTQVMEFAPGPLKWPPTE